MEQILEQVKITVIAGIVFGATAGIVNHYYAGRAVKELRAVREERTINPEK